MPRGCASEGLDAIVEGVPAYSTLGKFDDPILSTMMVYGDDELASIIFHELSHQVVYIAGRQLVQRGIRRDGGTGRAGALAEIARARGGSRASPASAANARRPPCASLRNTATGWPSLYASGTSRRKSCAARKAEVFAALVDELRGAGCALRLQVEAGRRARSRAPNNARLASLATYYDCVPGFQRVLAEQQHDLPKFYAAVHELARLPREERRAQLCASGKQS